MPSIKQKTHKGIKKRFKVSATGKVSHKRCGSSHLMSHKNGKKVRRLRKKSIIQVGADAQRLRRAYGAPETAHARFDSAPTPVEVGTETATVPQDEATPTA